MISYEIGDATDPKGPRPIIIAHICNDYGGWGRGFVVALSKKWPEPERLYRLLSKGNNPSFELGQVQFVLVQPDVIVANMVAQHGDSTPTYRAVKYTELEHCLVSVASKANDLGASVAMPRIGCGLGGGVWTEIEQIIEKTMPDIKVVVYDLP